MTVLARVKTALRNVSPSGGVPGELSVKVVKGGVQVILQSKLRDGRNWFNVTEFRIRDSEKHIQSTWECLCYRHRADVARENGPT